MSARIYDRPDLDQRAARLGLYVTGVLPDAQLAMAYEGRLLIHNGIGGLSVEQIDGDTLPNGYSLYIEGNEIVVAWPPYSETETIIPNPGFEEGDVGWVKGPGWTIGTENPITGARSARYGENPGISPINNGARYPINRGRAITASCNVRQGASAEGNAGARVKLVWLAADGGVVAESLGNAVMSASKNRVYPSTVVAEPPADAELVMIAADGIRYRENKALFVDDFAWDHVSTTGTNTRRTYQLTLRVRDSAARSYIWRGSVSVARLHPVWASAPVDPSNSGTIFKSVDGVTWPSGSYVTAAPAGKLAGMIFAGGNRLFALDDDSVRRVSSDEGETFTDVLGIPPGRPRSMCFTGEAWIVFPYVDFDGVYGNCWRSIDGSNFSMVNLGFINYMGGCIARGGTVLIGRRGSGLGLSTDHGQTFQNFTLPPGFEGEYFADSGALFAGCGSGNVSSVFLSPDASNGSWTASALPSTVSPRGIAYGNGRFVLIDRDGVAYVRPDSTGAWVQGGTAGPIDNTATPYTNLLIFAQDVFVAAGSDGKVYTSPDGMIWAQSTISTLPVSSLAWQR